MAESDGAGRNGPERPVGPVDQPGLVPRRELLPSQHVRGRAVGLEGLRGQLVQLGRHGAEQLERLREPDVDLGLGERLGRRRDDGRPHLRVDLGIALREDGELPLLVAAGRRQHVVRQLGGLRHRRIDDDQQIEPLACLAPALGVRVRQHRVRALDDDGADALGMVDQRLLRHQRGREHARVAERADGGDAGGERPLGLPDQARVDHRRGQHLEEDAAARVADVAGEEMEQPDQPGVEGRERRLLDAQVEEDGRRLGRGEAPRGLGDLLDAESAALPHLGDVHGLESCPYRLEAGGAPGHERLVGESLAHDHGGERQQQVDVGAGPYPEMAVRPTGGLGLPRIDHHQRAAGLVHEALQGVGRIVAAVGDLRVGPHDEEEARVLGVGMEERGGGSAEHPLVEEVVLRLLLREGVEPAARAERAQEADTVGAVHVVALSADADQRDRTGRVPVPDLAQPAGDLADRRVPGDALERPVRTAAQRVLGALRVAHVGPDAERLVADVALGDRVALVGAHLDDLAVPHVDAQPAVVAAQHARGGEVVAVERDRRAGDGGIDCLRLHHEASSGRARSAGPACARMSRAVTGSAQSGQASTGVMTCPQPRWISSTGGPGLARHPAIAPPDERHDDWVEIAALLGEPVLEARRPLLVAHPLEDAGRRPASSAGRQGDGG